MRVQNYSLLGGSSIELEPVPEWVHMAEVPPPVDEEPWDLTEGATAASGRWVTALVVVLVLLGLVGLAVWVAK